MPILRGLIPPLLGKALLVGALIILLLVPIAQVDHLVGERVGMRTNAAARVAESWGGPQTTGGVLLAIPVDQTRVIYGSRTEIERRMVYVLPDTLKVDASSEPSYRTVGLYRTPVYLARVGLSGEFAGRDFAQWFEEKEGRTLRWDQARLLVLNSEASSLRAVDDFTVAGEDTAVSAGGYAGFAGISTVVPRGALREAANIPFRVTLTLAGSRRLDFLALARKADVEITSTWEHPKFEGAPAPLSPTIGKQGFKARWSVLEMNRSFGQTWLDEQVRPDLPAQRALQQSTVGVTFYEPVDIYQRNYRAVHYAALFIVITFLAFFLWEHVSGLVIHAMQYLMVGLALALFYLLLLALSEHLSFELAYVASASALVSLITVYLSGALRSTRLALGVGAGLATLYTMLYWILRSEDYSLLMGSLLLFGLLTVLMLATRRVDWGGVGSAPNSFAKAGIGDRPAS
jgi:inner membrane protein